MLQQGALTLGPSAIAVRRGVTWFFSDRQRWPTSSLCGIFFIAMEFWTNRFANDEILPTEPTNFLEDITCRPWAHAVILQLLQSRSFTLNIIILKLFSKFYFRKFYFRSPFLLWVDGDGWSIDKSVKYFYCAGTSQKRIGWRLRFFPYW